MSSSNLYNSQNQQSSAHGQNNAQMQYNSQYNAVQTQGSQHLANKEKMRIHIETNVTERVKHIFKDSEVELDKQLNLKLNAVKDDVNSQQVKSKIRETSENNDFGKLAVSLRTCKNINPNQRISYSKTFEDLQILFNSIDKSTKDVFLIKVKINVYINEFTKQTFKLFAQLNEDYIKLNQAGFCSVGALLKGFQDRYREFEFKAMIWKVLVQMENQNIEYQVLKPTFNEKEFKAYISQQINQTYPEMSEDGKEVIKYIEVPKIQIVEKTHTKEVPVVVEKIVEKIVYKEIKVPEIREVIKEVIRNVDVSDKIREAHEMLFGMGKPQNVTEALNIYYEEAEVNNNVVAYNAIGQIFMEGKFFPKDLNKSYNYYEKSASMQDPEGLYRVGQYLYLGIIDGHHLSRGRLDNRDKELDEAVSYFQKSAEQGHLDALTDLGEIFEHGLPSAMQEDSFLIQPELEQAEFYFTQGKKVRYPRAICLLGLFYLNNAEYKQKVKGDNARKAIKYFELARDLGFAKAYFYLASCYESGQGVNGGTNIESAKNYYKEGSLRGDKDCKIHYMYYMMQSVSNNGRSEEYQVAYNFFRDILIQDPQIPDTYFYLGHLYECGFGVAKDPHTSLSYYYKGAQLKSPNCMNKIGDFYNSGYGVPMNKKESFKWYQQAAELKDAQALINLGTIYDQGQDGVPIDRAKAFNCYEEASKLQNPMAFFHLGMMYEAGHYVNRDMKTAVEMYKKAAQMGCLPARDILAQKNIPIIYQLGIDTTNIEMEENNDTMYTGQMKRGFSSQMEATPLISNPLVSHMGKKSNQNILQAKQDRQNDNVNYQSILQYKNQGQNNQNQDI